MKILFAASEMAPLAKVGGLADVLYSLPKALLKVGVDARVIIPKYEQINFKGLFRLANASISIGGKKEKISLYKTKVGGVEVYLLENKKYLSKGEIYYSPTAFSDDFKEIQRFVFFSVAIFELLRQNLLPFKPDIVHCNDWHSGALISLIKKFDYLVKTVFTIHNLANQGKWNAKKIEKWLSFKQNKVELWQMAGREKIRAGRRLVSASQRYAESHMFKKFGKNFNFMAEGVMGADFLTTVSPSYAKEIITKECGKGLENILKKRKNKLRGVLNGIDYDFFNPAGDRFLFKNYSSKDPVFKKENKFFLQRECGLTLGEQNAVFGLVSRLTKQKGINLIVRICGSLAAKRNAQFVFLGRGEAAYERALKKLSKKYPKNIFVKIGFDEKLAHRIYAGSDFFLMPSLFEPCGLGQMIALGYGTIPIIRKTGGLKDTIFDGKNGFSFKNPESGELKKAMLRALRLFNQKNKFEQMQKYGMKQNFSWKKSAIKYKEIYKGLCCRN